MDILHPFDDDKLHEECGIFGVSGHEEAAALVALGLHALQHRGQEAAGIAAYDGETFSIERENGLVSEVFEKGGRIKYLKGNQAIGHVRYSTTGGSLKRNIQPFYADVTDGFIAVAHNGNITNGIALRKQLQMQGAIFSSTSDTETIIHLVARSPYRQMLDRVIDALKQLEGAYSLVALTKKKLIGVRDPLGVRPLVIGKLNASYVLASETCALDIIGAEYLREVEPGELVVISDEYPEKLRSFRPFGTAPKRFCIFEFVYFARPDSVIDGKSVYSARKRIGIELAREAPVEADLIVPVPDSGLPAAIGYAEASGIPFELGIIRNHYVGRTFIQPSQEIRDLGVKMKHNPARAQLKGKRVVLVDDSIVRGTTSMKIVQMVRDAGATEVHMRIASPPTTDPCFYGVDTPEKKKLLAAIYGIAYEDIDDLQKIEILAHTQREALERMRRHIRTDSLAFVSVDGLYRAMGEAKREGENRTYCDACFTGQYPTSLTDHEDGDNVRQLSLLRTA